MPCSLLHEKNIEWTFVEGIKIAPYRKDALLQRLLREALSSSRRIIAPGFQHETTPAIVHSAIPSISRLRRWCNRPTPIRASQGCQGSSDLLRGLVMTRQTERGTGSHAVPVPHSSEPLSLIRAYKSKPSFYQSFSLLEIIATTCYHKSQ